MFLTKFFFPEKWKWMLIMKKMAKGGAGKLFKHMVGIRGFLRLHSWLDNYGGEENKYNVKSLR